MARMPQKSGKIVANRKKIWYDKYTSKGYRRNAAAAGKITEGMYDIDI